MNAQASELVELFRKKERSQFKADRDAREFEDTLLLLLKNNALSSEDQKAYFDATEEIIAEYEEKRRKARL